MSSPSVHALTSSLALRAPDLLRWGGAVARRLRQHNIALTGKSSGSALTDALTLADLTVQELLVAGLRDGDPLFRTCRIEAEESTGDLAAFAEQSSFTIALDPIDGTRQYQDRTGNGYCLILTLRGVRDVHYSLIYLPEWGPHGHWVQAVGSEVAHGPDDPSRPAADVVRRLPIVDRASYRHENRIYLIGFQRRDAERAADVARAGLIGVAPDEMPGSIYELMARGAFAGSLIHTPNVYDYPASAQIARILGGDSWWVATREPVHFAETWVDARADMRRLPGIVATSSDRAVLERLCALAKDWNPVRYAE